MLEDLLMVLGTEIKSLNKIYKDSKNSFEEDIKTFKYLEE